MKMLPRDNLRKFFFALVPFFAISFIIISPDFWIESYVNSYNFSLTHHLHPGFIIFTSTCRIPNVHPFDPSIKEFYSQEPPIVCDKYPFLTYTIGKKLYFDEIALDDLKKQHGNIKCCRQSLKRLENGHTDDGIKYSKKCKQLNFKPVVLKKEFNRVLCRLKNKNKTEVYKNFHPVVLRKKSVEKKFKKLNPSKISSKDSFNIILLGIDCLSRLNFHRHLNKTIKILKELDAIEMLGYNKVGDNTFPNLIPMTTGLTEEELSQTCWKENGALDKCNFIWTNLTGKGYRTMISEDTPHISSFNYAKKGFFKQPTDYYPRPIMLAAEEEIGYHKDLNCAACFGPLTATEFLLKYTFDYAKEFQNEKAFALTWINSLTHDYLNWPAKADVYYAKFFKHMMKSGALNRTIIIFLSDHGMRWGGIESTYVGKLENRLPLCYILLPERFRKIYPKISKTVQENANRLVTPFDIHATMRNILDFEGAPIPTSQWFSNKTVSSRAISLFQQIPENRTCKSAGIPITWCTCHNIEDIPKTHKSVLSASKYAVMAINNKLEQFKQLQKCANLSLKEVQDSKVTKPLQAALDKEEKKLGMEYLWLTLVTQPGNAVFEITVKRVGNTFTLEGDIGRSNLYGNQSYCTDVLQMKKICYCKYFLKNS